MLTTLKHKLIQAALCLMAFLPLLATATEEYIYFDNDPFGNPVAATDANGNIVWKETYKPYGEQVNKQAASANNHIWFHGKSFDQGTGLSYFGARYYDPVLGRFMGVDPVDFREDNIHSFNRYAYGNNNPYRYRDPDGRSPIDLGFLVFDLANLMKAINQGDGIGHAAIDVGISVLGVMAPVPGAGEAIKAARAVEHVSEVARGAAEGGALTSRAARRESMREAGIPTSQQPLSQSRNASGREYSYDVSASGGGTQRMSVQQQTMDRSHQGQPHWEAGPVKTDPLTGAVRDNNYGRPALTNNKSKVDY